MIVFNEAEYLLEWLDVAVANTTLVSKSKLYSLLKEGWK
jgi:predicted HAD superfamily phosphohydrolase